MLVCPPSHLVGTIIGSSQWWGVRIATNVQMSCRVQVRRNVCSPALMSSRRKELLTLHSVT